MAILSLDYLPIDFIKAKVNDLSPEHFTSNPLFTNNITSIFKNDILSKTILKFQNLEIRIFENNNRIELLGSLHTFYNKGKHNHNDFNNLMFLDSLNRLKIELGISPENLYILQLEWGFNIKPPMNCDYILDRLIQHNSVNKTIGKDSEQEGKYIKFEHSDYTLKAYNKGKYFNLKKEILRIELKQTNWRKYRIKGIITLADFIKTDKTLFLNELIHQWNRIIFYDIKSEDEKLTKYLTPTFWKDLRKNKSRKTFKAHFDKLKRLNKVEGYNNQDVICKLMIQKGNELQL